MANIGPVSDLNNYNTVLENVKYGSPVHLTVNGRGKYTIRDIAEDEAIIDQALVYSRGAALHLGCGQKAEMGI